jgi:hypothetical protein
LLFKEKAGNGFARPKRAFLFSHLFIHYLNIKTMKKILLSMAVFSALLVLSCGNNNAGDGAPDGHNQDAGAPASGEHASSEPEKEIPVIAVQFSGIDKKVTATIKNMVDGYLEVKNALVEGKTADAAKGANNIRTAMKGMDKSLMNAEQKLAYDAAVSNLSVAAEAIATSETNLTEQRNQFYPMSQGMYQLVKAFGGGRPLYHDHCPMARDNQGALWVSETKDIKNPYFGDEMLTCGTVEEVIQ